MKFYSVIKKNKIMVFAEKLMELILIFIYVFEGLDLGYETRKVVTRGKEALVVLGLTL